MVGAKPRLRSGSLARLSRTQLFLRTSVLCAAADMSRGSGSAARATAVSAAGRLATLKRAGARLPCSRQGGSMPTCRPPRRARPADESASAGPVQLVHVASIQRAHCTRSLGLFGDPSYLLLTRLVASTIVPGLLKSAKAD